MTYKVYYPDGTVFEGNPGDSPPARGVQVILQDDPTRGPYFQSGSDYYVWRDGSWCGVDKFGLFDFLLDSGLVLFGRTLQNAEYAEIYQAAKADKNQFLPGERKP